MSPVIETISNSFLFLCVLSLREELFDSITGTHYRWNSFYRIIIIDPNPIIILTNVPVYNSNFLGLYWRKCQQHTQWWMYVGYAMAGYWREYANLKTNYTSFWAALKSQKAQQFPDFWNDSNATENVHFFCQLNLQMQGGIVTEAVDAFRHKWTICDLQGRMLHLSHLQQHCEKERHTGRSADACIHDANDRAFQGTLWQQPTLKWNPDVSPPTWNAQSIGLLIIVFICILNVYYLLLSIRYCLFYYPAKEDGLISNIQIIVFFCLYNLKGHTTECINIYHKTTIQQVEGFRKACEGVSFKADWFGWWMAAGLEAEWPIVSKGILKAHYEVIGDPCSRPKWLIMVPRSCNAGP